MNKPTFEVDKQGLAKLLEKRGVAFAVTELVQNALDEDVTEVAVDLTPISGTRRFKLYVADDSPEGFKDLTHAYTLFAESAKKGDPEKRGRFNLGEKLVIAICTTATISTTKGTITFTEKGRTQQRAKRERGTTFTGEVKMTVSDAREVDNMMRSIIVPSGITLYYNGQVMSNRTPRVTFEATLPTLNVNDEGVLRPTRRKTVVEIHMPLSGQPARIYEMGLPVVETDGVFDINVGQKVPLNMDRDNVTPAYLRELRAAVLNNVHEELGTEDASDVWVNDALESPDVEPEAVESIMTARFGERRVIFDPSDPEANRLATARGYTVVPGRSFNRKTWANIRNSGAIEAAGKVTPSPRPFSPDGEPLNELDSEKWTPGIAQFVAYAEMMGRLAIEREIRVAVVNDFTWGFNGAFGRDSVLYVNVGTLGYDWFAHGLTLRWDDFLIHEFGHKDGASHLSSEYYNALTKIGSQFAQINREHTDVLRGYCTAAQEVVG